MTANKSTSDTKRRKVAVVGAGYISDSHLEVLKSLPSVELVAIVDSNEARAQSKARKWGVPRTYPDVAAAMAGKMCDVAHVLVPPNLHKTIAVPLLRGGVSVMLEKPMGVSASECETLNQAATAGGALLGVNQNFVFAPAYVALKRHVKSGALGNLRHVVCWYNMPLRQLAARQFGHWMFRLPQNILLEQAVHPLSQICDLAGLARHVVATPGAPLTLAPGRNFYKDWQVALQCERADAQILLSFGQDNPAWGLLAIGDDGVAQLDVLNNRVTFQDKTRWPDFFDSYLNDARISRQISRQNIRRLAGYVMSTLRLMPRSDPFFLSMHGSIAAFYDGLAKGALPLDGKFGAHLVGICERIAGPLAVDPDGPRLTPGHRPVAGKATACDVAVLGGTGFIGASVVRKLLEAGNRPRVMARNIELLPAPFDDDRVEVVAGDIGRPESVAAAIDGCKTVINLAHGGGGATYLEIEQAMVGGAVAVARACLEKGVERLIYVSSIAALYLGDPNETITGQTPVDPQSDQRADYARAKAVSERALMDLRREKQLPLCILRPGVVVGEGGVAFHSGLGLFNRDRHCIGWNDGRNPLPFVLVEDVATAVLAAMRSGAMLGHQYNVVGDTRMSASEYIAELGRALGRPLVFHPQRPWQLQAVEVGKWLVKRAIGRKVAYPAYRDLLSRGLTAAFDCSDLKRDGDWRPVSDRAEFIRRGIDIYRAG